MATMTMTILEKICAAPIHYGYVNIFHFFIGLPGDDRVLWLDGGGSASNLHKRWEEICSHSKLGGLQTRQCHQPWHKPGLDNA